jgi:hypothetical protein
MYAYYNTRQKVQALLILFFIVVAFAADSAWIPWVGEWLLLSSREKYGTGLYIVGNSGYLSHDDLGRGCALFERQ